jgi:ubiquinone/menaquinone biosynthesis C-methylase UbiE
MLAGDSEEAKIDPVNQTAKTATDMEKKHVYEVYEKIAPHFSNTRYKPWPKIKAYLDSLPVGSLNCDVGCGNGKYLGVNKQNVFSIGTDRSFGLIDICREKDKDF